MKGDKVNSPIGMFYASGVRLYVEVTGLKDLLFTYNIFNGPSIVCDNTFFNICLLMKELIGDLVDPVDG